MIFLPAREIDMKENRPMKQLLRTPCRPAAFFGMLCLLAMTGASVSADELGTSWRFSPSAQVLPAIPELAAAGGTEVQLVLDDGTAEGEFGAGASTARQFMWFNSFSAGSNLLLEEIWVLFPSGTNIQVGEPIDLVVFGDADGDPSNGANLLTVVPEVIQQNDGVTFSIYSLAAPLTVGEGNVYLGVIPRFIVSGVTPATLPAALDIDSSQQSSWIALWSGDPPSQPLLPPDVQLNLVDDLIPGNWMIRGFGRSQPVLEVPVLDCRGLATLVVLLLVAGLLALRSTSRF